MTITLEQARINRDLIGPENGDLYMRLSGFYRIGPDGPVEPESGYREFSKSAPIQAEAAAALLELAEEAVCWSPRGVGSNWDMHDIRSHAVSKELTPDLSGYVKTREDGEKAVRIFGGAFLDYRPSEPHYIQVKIGSTDADTLYALHILVRKNNNMLTRCIIEQAIVVGDLFKDGRVQWTT